MKHFKQLWVSAAALVLSTAVYAEKNLHVYNWSDYIDESLLEKFEQETGTKVVYDVFDSNEVLETKLLAGSTGYDVVVPSATFLAVQIQAGVFQPLDYSKLTNAEHLWDTVKERAALYDPENKYSVNYMWGTTGLGVNVDKVKKVLGDDAPINSLDLIFNPENMKKLTECGVMFLDAPTEVLPAAIKYIGENPDSRDPKVIAKAGEVLKAVRPYVRKFHNSESINALANGEICVALGWSGDLLQARDRATEADNGVNIEYHIPKEGALMWFDQMAIPVDAKNPAAAHAFINFMMDPENMATASNYVYYANGNYSSQKLLNDDVIGDSAIYPDEKTEKNLYTIMPYDPKTSRIVTRLWTKIKSGI